MSTTLTKQFNKTVDLVVSPTNNNPAKITLEIDAGNSETINLSTIAANASTAATDVSGATDVNTPSTIVKRDASGNFSAGIINADIIGNVTGNVSGTASSITGNLTGDVTSSGMSTTLATVNTNTGLFGSSTAIPSFTVNGKGLITAASTNVVVAPASTLTGTTLASNVVTSSLTSVGTISSGTWSGTTIAIAKGGTGQTTANSAVNALLPTQTSNTGKFLTTDGTDTSWATVASGGTGTVTSVDLSVPAEFTVSGNPVTTSGTLTVTKANQNANIVYAGPTAGAAAAPTFRSLVVADVPTLNQNTTGSAAKWTTARNLAGNSVDGSANVAFANKFIVQGTADTGLSAAQFLGALGTGILKNTTTTGVLSIAVAGDFPTLNQNTTGSAATLTTPRAINGTNFDGSAAITVTASAGTLTGTTLNSTVVTSSLTSVGTITSGTWGGTTIALNKGGTGQTTKAAAFDALQPMTTSGDIIYGGASGTGTRLAKGSDGNVLTLASGLPSWVAPSGSATITSWASYTPTFTNLGTPSNVNFYWRQVGPDSIDIQGRLTVNTGSAAEAKISLPASTSIATGVYSSIAVMGLAGYEGADVGNVYVAVGTSGNAYFGLSGQNKSGGFGSTPYNGSDMAGNVWQFMIRGLTVSGL